MKLLLVCAFLACVDADTYASNPRGSNNRLNEQTVNRKQGNRMFDSQNNNRGGHNVGDLTHKPSGDDASKQYKMKYFMSGPNYKTDNGKSATTLLLEWTNQHGCGGNEGDKPQVNMICQYIIQFMCQPEGTTNDTMRDGTSTDRQDYEPYRHHNLPESAEKYEERKAKNVKADRGLHERHEWHDKCRTRQRNKGLFTADQKVNNHIGATATRQNRNGNRNGYECPEERDYYPYWHPSDWKDIAILAENVTFCQDHMQKYSFNNHKHYECVEYFPGCSKYSHKSKHNNQKDCEEHLGKWTAFTNYLEKAPQHTSKSACEAASTPQITYVWGIPMFSETLEEECLVALDPPECQQAPWNRDNHLGNTLNGQSNSYEWTIPYFPSKQTQNCVLRFRYNITTGDYDPYRTNASSNNNDDVISDDPKVDMGVEDLKLQLALNTAQTGRTFEDRSHVFQLVARESGFEDRRIHNLNVRGKRGHIQQVYPATPYDFIPNELKIQHGDVVHWQWTGSNTHNNKGAGDEGEGKEGTDRHNVVQIADKKKNYFEMSMFQDPQGMFAGGKVLWTPYQGRGGAAGMTPLDKTIQMATSGYLECEDSCPEGADSKTMDPLMNNAPATFQGMLIEHAIGTYHYMCTRNSNFGKRDQKGTLVVY